MDDQLSRTIADEVNVSLGELPADTFPLSPNQQRLWFLEQLSPGGSAYNLPEAWRLNGKLNVHALEQCFTAMVQRHESFRTQVFECSGVPVQRICAPKPFVLELVDLTSEPAPEERMRELISEAARRPFDLSVAPLLRCCLYKLADEHHVLLVNMHHIISDEWSLGIFFREVAELYRQHIRQESKPLPELPIQYADYALWAREQLDRGRFRDDLHYWKERLVDSVPRLDLPAKSCTGAPPKRGTTIFRTLRGNTPTELKRLAHRHRTTLFVVLLAAWKAVLSRYTRQEDIVVGTLEAGRHVPETEGVIGFFVSTVPVRTSFPADAPIESQIQRVHEAVLDAMAHSQVPTEEIVKAVQPQRSSGSHPLFSVLFGLQPGATESWEMPGLATSRIEIDNGGAKFDLALLATETADGLRLRCEFDCALLSSELVDNLLSSYSLVLDQVTRDPGLTVAQLRICAAEQSEFLLKTLNNTAVPWPADKLLHQLIEERAAAQPDAIAVVCGEQRLCYGQLNEMASVLATLLARAGIEAEQPVGICMRRSARMIVAMLAVLKAGAAYLPLDPSYPKERLALMVRDSGARIVLTERDFTGLCGPGVTELAAEEWNLDNPVANGTLPLRKIRPQDLAYIIYTSGSTGVPKGVALEHRNAVAFLSWAGGWFRPSELSGVLAATSICFDLSVFEIFVPLAHGGKVLLVDNALSLASLSDKSEVTLINTVPSAMRELVRGGFVPPSVRVVNLAGEPLDASLVDDIYRTTNVEKVYDLYGPTETTTYSTGARRVPGGPATIGQPLANERVYLLDGHRRLVPPGAIGEMYIAGAGVGRGYLNRPQLTAERFFEDPFHPGDRMYRTGDVARIRGDGNLEYLGRIDNQVKIRGYRIELGEIETALRRLPDIKDAAVVVREDQPGDKRLVAYVVAQRESRLSGDELRRALGASLPGFMIPAAFVSLSALPLTPNGKIDRRILPPPGAAASESRRTYQAPRNEMEQRLVEIWQELLGRNSFGTDDDFFSLGGHSLLAMQVASRIWSAFNVRIPLRAVFEAPTVSGLAAVVMEMQKRAVPEAPIPRNLSASEAADVLARLDSLSDADVEELLRSTSPESFQT